MPSGSALHVATVPEAIEAMRDLGSALPKADGVACFNSMYLAVTESVACRLDAGMFSDPEFMDRLDVNFANLYLDAYARQAAASGETICASWRALFDSRLDDRLEPLQFALAGMNAHINHDLPLAVTMTAEELGRPLTAAGVRDDFVAVNRILSDADDAVRASLQGPVAALLDDLGGPVDDAFGAWGISRAREAAWGQALQLSELVDDPPTYSRFLSKLDRIVAFAGRCLLMPVGDGKPAAVPAAVLSVLENVGNRMSDLLWGDEVVDGDDDGLIGSIMYAVRKDQATAPLS